MKKFISFASLSIIFGVLISWGEGMLSLLNYKSFNIIDFAFLSLLLSLLVMLLLIVFSGNFVNALFSLTFYVGTYLGTKLCFGYPVNLEVYTYSAILIISGLLTGMLIYTGNHLLRSFQGKLYVKKDIAIPIIFFLVSILFSAFVVLAEQKAMYPVLLRYFYSYVYFLVSLSLVIAIFSVSEIAGFLMGLFSMPIYFLMNRMIINNFDISFLIYNEKSFLILVSIYSLLFAVSTLIMGYAGKVFVSGIVANRMVQVTNQTSKESFLVNKANKSAEKSSKNTSNRNVFGKENSANAQKGSSKGSSNIKDVTNRGKVLDKTKQIDNKVNKENQSKSDVH